MRTGYLQLSGTAAVLALGLLLNGAAWAGDLLQEAKAKQAIEAQRMEKLVDDTRSQAKTLAARGQPTTGLELLQSTLASLETDTALPEDKRGKLIRVVKYDIRDLESQARDRKAGIPINPPPSGRADEERRQADAELIKRSQNEARAAESAGRNDEARRIYEDLRKRFPGNPSIQARSDIGGRADRITSANDIERQRGESVLKIWDSERKMAILPSGDIQWPTREEWERTKNKTSNRMKITAKEKAIIQALNTVISVEFDMKTTFQDVIDYFEKKTGQTLIIDKQAMAEANVTYDSPVNFKAKTTLRTVLRRILADLNLAYVVKDEAIQVTSIQKAKETLSTRIYYIGDLTGIADMRLGPLGARVQVAAQLQMLANVITSQVEPDSWLVNERGGLGTIAYDPLTKSFVVRQTAEIHYLMGLQMR
jgi:hypothetical protein